MVTKFASAVEVTLLVVFIVSPISENCGLWNPITPAMTGPLCMPIFRLIGVPFSPQV